MRIIITIFISMLSIGILAMPASAQSRKELGEFDTILDQRLTSLEQRFLTGDPAAERLMQRMDTLESSQRALTGEIEQLRYERDTYSAEVKALSDEIAVLKSEMASRPAAIVSAPQTYSSEPYVSEPYVSDPYTPQVYGGETYGSQTYESLPQAAPLPAPETGTMGSSIVDMAELQNIGQQKLMAGDFTGAQLAYKQYVDLNPNAPDIGDAHFWLAETYFVKSGYSDAADNYIASMRAAPDGDKAPNALIGLAASLRSMGNTDAACQTLEGFGTQFPSAASDLTDKADIERQRAGCV